MIAAAAPSRPWHSRAFLKHLVWTAASSIQLGGLWPFDLQHDWITINRVEMPMPGLGREFDGARIAHISDLHCSPFVLESYLRRCVAAVNRLVPDFVVITGDFITGGRSHARGVAGVLAGLRPTVGTLAVMGNHDYGIIHPSGRAVGGLADYLQDQLSLEADIFVLRNEIHTFRRGSSAIQFIGLDDYWTQFDPRTAFERRDGAVPAVALCHNPDATPQLLRQGVPWILSGHTHGKVTPNFAMLDRLMPMEQRNLVAGHYRLGQDQNLYVNRGLGHAWRMRACDRPEITPADAPSLRITGRPGGVNDTNHRDAENTENGFSKAKKR